MQQTNGEAKKYNLHFYVINALESRHVKFVFDDIRNIIHNSPKAVVELVNSNGI